MQTSDFFYDLPEQLIAQFPLETRAGSRLLNLDENGQCHDRQFSDLPSRLRSGDLLVINNTRVMPARMFATKETGGKLEVLVERLLGVDEVLAHVKSSKSPKPGSRIIFEHGTIADVIERQGSLFKLRLLDAEWLDLMQQQGHMPLPPYIRREDGELDENRYQTVFGRELGAVAAPTAGLHFDDPMLQQLRQQAVEIAEITLHVGAGTFQPVRVENIDDHEMHSEWLEVSQSVCDQIAACKERGGRVVAVGTTCVRSLETAARDGELKPFSGDTRIFIRPGYEFGVVDALVTNFHLPESTLIMLVAAFAGYGPVMNAYRHAVEQQYRFFSYGDAMFIEKPKADEF